MKVIEIISALRKINVKLELDESNLKLIGNTTDISQKLLGVIKERKEELIEFLRSSQEKLELQVITKAAEKTYYPLSNAQRRLWLLSQFEGGNQAYNITTELYLNGSVIIEKLEEAFKLSIAKHESLRTIFTTVEDEPVQKILPFIPFSFDFVDFQGFPNKKQALKEEVGNAKNRIFNLEKGPLLHVKLITISSNEYALLFSIHHIITDGWSIGVLVREIMAAYKELCLGNAVEEKVEQLQYKDFTEWISIKLKGESGEEASSFWKHKKMGEVNPISLPTDFKRPDINLFKGASQKFFFNADFHSSIEQFARNNQVTIFQVYRACLSVLLHKLSGQNEVIIGTPVSGRSHPQLYDQVGLYVNTLPLLSKIDGQETFENYLENISKDSLKCFEYQDYPLDLIIEESNVNPDTSRNPLFDVMMVLQNTAIGDGSIDFKNQHGFQMTGLDLYLYDTAVTEYVDVPSKFDLSFNFALDSMLGHFVDIEYRTKLFNKSTIQRIHTSFEYILKQVIANKTISLNAIQLIDAAEKDIILTRFNQPFESITETCLFDLLTPSFAQNGTKIALSVGDRNVSYIELSQRAEQVAAAIQYQIGTSGGVKIALLVERSEYLMYSILGILKSGNSYVPVDIAYPDDRISYILEDSNVAILLADSKGKSRIPENFQGTVIDVTSLEELPFLEVEIRNQDDTAYLIYTSGSTGKPKGVEITHLNMVSFLKWSILEFKNTPYDCLFAATSYCFDLSVFEMFMPLIQGKRIRILKSALEIMDYAPQEKGIFINTVPSVVRNLLDQNFNWQNVVALNMAGEPVPVIFKDLLDFKRIEVRNLYGPSEDTTYSTMYRFRDGQYDSIPIGTPVGYTQAYILDSGNNLMPIGVEGEICLSGLSVAKGYLNREELTAEKFCENPFVPGYRMYRTGDLGKWMPDGKLAYIGRMDDQVKVRGYRIELGEIQYRIEQLESVQHAVVVVREIQGENTIVAYWQSTEVVAEDVISEHLKAFLPHYMIPTHFVFMEEIPLNSNGKVDKKKLPLPEKSDQFECIQPENEFQQKLYDIWVEVLKITAFGITDNFFELGGHSLRATKLRGIISREIGKDITINEIFLTPTIKGQAQLLETKGLKEVQVIQATEEQAYYPVSFTQERLWVLTQFEEASKAYHMPAAFRINGQLDYQRLEEAVNMVVEKHESLRTVFKEMNGDPVQCILPMEDAYVKIDQFALDSYSGALNEFLISDWARPFDLHKGPLLRCSLIRASSETILSFNMHHIISDGWSINVLFSDVTKAYSLLTNKNRQSLVPLEIQFKDFAIWQRNYLTDDKLQEQLSYWKDTVFAQGVSALELPLDFHRPEIKTYNGDTLHYTFSKELSQQVKQSNFKAGVSLFMSLMANVSILLKKLANQSDITIGTPISGRDTTQLQHQIGFFVNTLPIRTEVLGNMSYLELLANERNNILKAFDYQYFPFELLVHELQPKRDLSRSPLFDVMVVFQNMEVLEDNQKGFGESVKLEKVAVSSGITKYDLTFSFSEESGCIQLELEFNTDLFRRESIERYVAYLQTILETTSSKEEVLIADINIQSPAEQALIVSKGDRTGVNYNENETIISLFDQCVKNFPTNCALKVGDKEISYAELDQKSGQLARVLKEHQVQKEDLVVLHTDRSEWMLVAILGALKAGAAYVPVDPAYPASRIEYILNDSQSKLLLFDGELSEATQALIPQETSCLNLATISYEGEPYTATLEPEQLAYVIYTSGTTGNPKGVLVEHRNVNRLLFNDEDLFDFNEKDTWSLFHSYCFDFSVWEMYGALLKGGKLVMVPKEIAQDSSAFFDFLQIEKITVLNQTPTAFRSLSLLNNKRFGEIDLSVRYVVFGGEALMPEILEPWKKAYPQCKLINMYGITETTVHVTYKQITEDEIKANKSIIGDPIPTLSCYVLDQDLKPVTMGVVGELCVGGAGVARGYHNRPELTAEKFVDNPFRSNEKLYRSGDFARILSNGEIEYIGRKDEQVKIRGHRIEIGEIEAALLKLPEINDAVVLAKKNAQGEYELSAYIISDNPGTFSMSDLRLKLQKYLPAYMVPGYCIELTEFPITSNGKLDKDALPSLTDVSSPSTEYVAPGNNVEEIVVKIWEEILEISPIGIRDNFFDLGGHSLKATRVLSKIQLEFGVKIDLKNLFIDPTVEHLANYIETVLWIENDSNVNDVEQDQIVL
ncbi:MAG: amino acid adenylation domain-containing protein [Fluviicola sp.]